MSATLIIASVSILRRKYHDEHYCSNIAALHPIQRTYHTATTDLQRMGVNHCRLCIIVPEQFLHGADVVAGLQHLGGEQIALTYGESQACVSARPLQHV